MTDFSRPAIAPFCAAYTSSPTAIPHTCDSKQPWHVVRSAQSLLNLRVVFGSHPDGIGACRLWNSGSICCRRRTDWLQLFFHWGVDDGSWTRQRYLSRRGFASRDNVVYASIPTRTLLRRAVLRRFQYRRVRTWPRSLSQDDQAWAR